MRLNRRRLPLRRIARPSRPAPPGTTAPLEVPAEDSRSGESTPFAIASVPGASSSSATPTPETPAELPSVVPTIEEDEKGIEEAVPPDRLDFVCPCGAKLIAHLETYDRHSRCAECQTVLLLNLVYDPETGGHEIVPFRIDPQASL
jgi:hypothetical protein